MIQAPPGYVPDPNNAGWYFDPTADIQQLTAWWQMPPEGFVEDPNGPGWYFNPNGDVNVKENWWRQPWVPDPEPARPAALDFWTFEEVAQAANVQPYPNISDNWPGICEAATAWGIAQPLVLIGMVGTVAKETGSFYPKREAWWVWDVDPEAAKRYYLNLDAYGNPLPAAKRHAPYQGGTGWEYHGRGYPQTTHIGNYQNVKDRLASIGIEADTVGDPDLLLQPFYAAHAMAIYFLTHGYPPGGMVNACMNRQWKEVRKAIYGAYDPDGEAKIRHAEAVLLPLAQSRGFA